MVILPLQPPVSQFHFDLLRDVKILISVGLCHSPLGYFENQDTSEINLDSSNMNYPSLYFSLQCFPQLTPENRPTLLKSHIPAEHPCTVSFLLNRGGSHYLKKNLGRHHVFGPSGSTFRQEPPRELESPRKRDGQKNGKICSKTQYNWILCFVVTTDSFYFIC